MTPRLYRLLTTARTLATYAAAGYYLAQAIALVMPTPAPRRPCPCLRAKQGGRASWGPTPAGAETPEPEPEAERGEE